MPRTATSAPSAGDAPGGLRSRARRAMRAEVAEVAMGLFLDQGFDNTTVEQIAAATGMSRSSFFRYFATKEDVVLDNVADHGEQILAALIEQPDHEPLWKAIHAAFEPVVRVTPATDLDLSLRTARMFMETPTLQARHYEKTLTWQALLVPEVARRLDISEPASDPRPAALIASAIACLDAALRIWSHTDGKTPLTTLFDTAMHTVGAHTSA